MTDESEYMLLLKVEDMHQVEVRTGCGVVEGLFGAEQVNKCPFHTCTIHNPEKLTWSDSHCTSEENQFHSECGLNPS